MGVGGGNGSASLAGECRDGGPGVGNVGSATRRTEACRLRNPNRGSPSSWHTPAPAPPDSEMLRSMTAFASAEADSSGGQLAIELRSVNHRYLELGVRLSDDLRALEPAIRERVAAKLARGKVDLGIRFREGTADASSIRIDEAL